MRYRKIFTFLAVFIACISNSYAADDYKNTNLTNKNYLGDVKKNMLVAEKNLTRGKKFLQENAKKPGVVTLENGLQYKILTDGSGKKPEKTDTVVVDYSGKLINGEEFDSSYKRGQPASFPVNAVIPGWTQALQLMKVGSTWELYIPAQLGYGEFGAPPVIGPNEVLIFKVKLIEIK